MSKDQIKAKAKRLVSLLSAHEGPVQFQDALELLAQLEGHRNWKTLSAQLDRAPVDSSADGYPANCIALRDFDSFGGTVTGRFSSSAAASVAAPTDGRKTFHVPNELPYQQDEVPGVGFLFSVPISVDTSMTARVLVRARNREDAVDEARRLVSDGKAPMELDEGNYRGPGDYYCSDSSENGVYCPNEPTQPTVAEVDDGVQVGPYLVEVFKDYDDPTQVGADLLVYTTDEDGQLKEEGDPTSVSLTPLSPDAPLAEYIAFCLRTATALYKLFPDASKADRNAIDHEFRKLTQLA